MSAKRISSLHVVLGATVSPFVNAFRGAGSSVTRLVATLGAATAPILRFTGLAGGISAALGAIGGVGKGFKLAADFEQAETAMTTLLGSAGAAKNMLGQLTEYANATPFNFPSLVTGTQNLINFGVAQEKVIPTLKALGDVAGTLGKPVEDLALIYGQVVARTKLAGEELMQFAERGVPLRKELERITKTSGVAFDKLMSSGQISAGLVERAFMDMTAAGGTFAGGALAQANTLHGLWSTLSDTIGTRLMKVSQVIIEAFGMKAGIKSLTGGLAAAGDAAAGWDQEDRKALAPVVPAIHAYLRRVLESALRRLAKAIEGDGI